jgi:hypothetical protein
MRDAGRPSKVHNPSRQHATLTYKKPRTTTTGPIHRS